MKKLLGWALIGSPIWVVIAAAIADVGFKMTLAVIGVTLVLGGFIVLGIFLNE